MESFATCARAERAREPDDRRTTDDGNSGNHRLTSRDGGKLAEEGRRAITRNFLSLNLNRKFVRDGAKNNIGLKLCPCWLLCA